MITTPIDLEGTREMISDRELWACAAEVMRQHEDRAHVFVAERIGALALQADEQGVITWKAIASRMDQFTGGANGPNQ